eukprot:GHVP01011138.1.p1 GENE.GHVP01011138.1~~GHVP01011138.1.p1  ORF type:complete len:449 (+),score=61.02 GHVP01011138.1:31-1347(+)
MEFEVISSAIVLNVEGEHLRLTPDFRLFGLRFYMPYLCQDPTFCITDKSLSKVKWCKYKEMETCGLNITFDEALASYINQRYTRDGLEIDEDVISGLLEIQFFDSELNLQTSEVPALFVVSTRTPRSPYVQSGGSIGFLGDASHRELWPRKYRRVFDREFGTILWRKKSANRRVLQLTDFYDENMKPSSVDWTITGLEDVLVTINAVSTCNANLLPFTTGHWTAVIDPGSLCLSLPSFLLQNLMSWLPLNCPRDLPRAVKLADKFCRMPSNVKIEELPTIVFSLEEEQEISISFSDLLIESYEDETSFCLVEGIYRKRYGSSTFNPPIIFGSFALNSLDFEMASDSTGMSISTSIFSENSEHQYQSRYCKSSLACLSTQTYEEASNQCFDPSCDNYGWELHENTHSCQITVNVLLHTVQYSLMPFINFFYAFLVIFLM